MDFNKVELQEVEVASNAKVSDIQDLELVQLALVGGGAGDVSFS